MGILVDALRLTIIGIENSGGNLYTDQTALNYALWNERLAVSALPATCNWLCHLAAPLFDGKRERFCEPGIPGRPLGILHLAGNSKDQEVQVQGVTPQRTVHLRFPGSKPTT